MKKIIPVLGLSLMLTSVAYADGNAFTPLNFNDTTFSGSGVSSYSAKAVSAIAEAGAGCKARLYPKAGGRSAAETERGQRGCLRTLPWVSISREIP